METHGQINYQESAKSEAERKIRCNGRGMQTAARSDAKPEPLDVNGCIRRLTRLLSPEERVRLQTALADGELTVMGDPGQIAAMFFALVECAGRLVPGGNMTILTVLLPLDARLASENTDNGCALLSFHAAARGGERISSLAGLGYGNTLRPLSSVRNIVEQHHGCFRMCLRAAGISFNVYLPVMRRMPPTTGAGDTASAFPPGKVE